MSTHTESTEGAAPAAAPRRRLTIFRAADAAEVPDDMMPREGIDDTVLSALGRLQEADVNVGAGEKAVVLFKEPGENGMSLIHLWFKSGYVLPFHSHDTDCLYYVTAGEIRMGSNVLRKGDGLFIPAGQAYGYEAGPDGVEVLEFRNATHFNLRFQPNANRRWEQMVSTYMERAPLWEEETVPPSER